jgi:hypothetical protein
MYIPQTRTALQILNKRTTLSFDHLLTAQILQVN